MEPEHRQRGSVETEKDEEDQKIAIITKLKFFVISDNVDCERIDKD